VVLIIGGALGLLESLTKDYEKFALAKMIIPHELARVVAFERIYRALAIINGKTCHY
jgi:23S rRNA pseudoU1915 N3-methylase RlmH